MKTIFKHTLLSLALLAGAFTAQAQVKIGSSPTTIGANSNLEVQAVNGKKVIVDKAAGTVQVENLPAGAVIDSIVTADPTTGVLHRISRAKLQQLLNLVGPSKISGGYQNLNQGPNWADFTTVDYDAQGGADLANNQFVIQISGYYSYTVRQEVMPNGSGTFTMQLLTDTRGIDIGYASMAYGGTTTSFELNGTAYLTAGEKLKVHTVPCGGCVATSYQTNKTSLTLVKVF